MDERVAIIGLGYVGLPLFILSRQQGVDVVGYDVDREKIATLKQRENPLGEDYDADIREYVDPERVSDDESILDDADYYVITVPTPVNGKDPDYSYIESAADTIRQHITPGATVILESTVAPGTCRNVVAPILEESGLRVGADIFLAHCPERIDPGNEEWPLERIPRVLGGYTPAGRDRAKRFYETVLSGAIFEASSLEIAEASKITENAFRDINIAFVNELAQVFGALDISAKEVIEAASTKPFGFMAHWPGCGVGGHCIPVDPYYLIKESESHGYSPTFLSLAREINDRMPAYTVQRVVEGLNRHKMAVNGTRIGLLGLSYKGGIGDLRRSPGLEIKSMLEDNGAEVVTFDPHIDDTDVDTLDAVLDCDCLVIAADHPAYQDIEGRDLGAVKVVVDGKNMLDPDRVRATYVGIGRH